MLAHNRVHTSATAGANVPRAKPSGGSGSPPRLKAFAAEYGTALGGTERHSRQLTASRTGGLSFDLGVAVVLSGRRRRAEHGNPFSFAGLATLGFVLELLVVKEKLFPGGENKITSTVDTLQHLVLKFHLRMAPFSLLLTCPSRGKKCGGAIKNRLPTSPLVLPLDSARHAPERSVGTNYRALYAGRLMSI